LTYEDVEENFSSRHESSLTLVDEIGHNPLEARYQQLGDDLINDIAAGNRPKI